uniref:ubiquitinyl hydrolase 1 n=1 Tax=Xenopus tropicalis TaxID=8364 RepID=A0A803J7D5_XENTR
MDEAEGNSEESGLIKQHRKEKKDLQAKIQSMKNSVPKNDKKRRKQLTEDIAKLEADLDVRHKEELEAFAQKQPEPTQVSGITNGVTSLDLGNEAPVQQPRQSKAQKRREKKAAQEKERDERIAEAEIANLSGARHLESQKLARILAERELQIRQIPSDGHCMYRAIEHQLRERGNDLTVANLRSQTADYMQNHAEDFLPFLTNSSTGDMYTQEEFLKYCTDIVNTPAWGGQLEPGINEERRGGKIAPWCSLKCTPASSPISYSEDSYRSNPGRIVTYCHWRRILQQSDHLSIYATCVWTGGAL